MSYQHIEAHMEGPLGTITLNRPPVNILNIAMMEEINHVLKECQGRKNLKIILFNARGKCFSAGVDVKEHSGDLAPHMIEVFHGMFRLLDKLDIPTIASVHGACLGGGCELAIFCDLAVATEDAQFGQPEIKVGVFPPVAAQILPRIIGRKAAMDFILSGKIIPAAEARELGLVNIVVPNDRLEDETRAFVAPYLELSGEVLRKAKKAVLWGMVDDLEPSLKIIESIYLNELMKTHDANEGLTAFIEKRKPVWKNR